MRFRVILWHVLFHKRFSLSHVLMQDKFTEFRANIWVNSYFAISDIPIQECRI